MESESYSNVPLDLLRKTDEIITRKIAEIQKQHPQLSIKEIIRSIDYDAEIMATILE